jgi:hypothetical protein
MLNSFPRQLIHRERDVGELSFITHHNKSPIGFNHEHFMTRQWTFTFHFVKFTFFQYEQQGFCFVRFFATPCSEGNVGFVEIWRHHPALAECLIATIKKNR